MHERAVHLGWLGLILSLPLVIEAMSPTQGESWSMLAGRLGLMELVLVGGLCLASRHRRAVQARWYQPPVPVVPVLELSPAPEPTPWPRWQPAPARIAAVPNRTVTVG